MPDFSEPTEYADLRAAVREIARALCVPSFAEHARTATPQAELWTELGKAGFIGINVPTEYGGGGAGMSELALVATEAAAAGCPLLLLLVSSAIAVEVLRRHGTPEQKQEWLTRLSDGSIKVAFAITEPDAGSNSHHISTTAVRDGDDYVITGSKYYISGDRRVRRCPHWSPAPASTRPAGEAPDSLFLVPTDTPGLCWQPLPVAAQIPDRQFTVFYDEVTGAGVGA